MIHLPKIALSVRQPWAWAIVAGSKDVENRTTFAVSKAGFDAREIAIHASKGMTLDEYEYAADFMASLGVECPRPDDLIRGAIIGSSTVTAVVKASDSRWFFGPRVFSWPISAPSIRFLPSAPLDISSGDLWKDQSR